MTYSLLKRLLPRPVRTFGRDLDRAYQERLKEIDSKNRYIEELEKEISRLRPRENFSAEDFEKINKQGLFVVGNARSGTSIIWTCLNISKHIFLLGEANLYLHYFRDNFVDYFNEQHLSFNNRRSKGTFVPPSIFPERGGLSLFSRMNRHYIYVGEKIAFGPAEKCDNEIHQNIFFNFHAKYFYFSTYLLIIRKPIEVVWSMLKKFPEKKLTKLFECWLRTIQIQLDVYQTFPNSYVMFFEDLNCNFFTEIGSIIGIDLYIPEGMLIEENKHSLLGDDQIPNELLNYQEICHKCSEIYNLIRREFSRENFPLKERSVHYAVARYQFCFLVQGKIKELLSEVVTD